MKAEATNLDDVVSEILRSGVRWADLPPPVAALFGARHLLAGRSEQEQVLIHGIAMARFTGIIPRRDTAGPQRIRWARLRRDPLHLTLTGHRTSVRRLATVPLASGRVLLAGVSVDAVRLWDPWNGDLVGREIVPDSPDSSVTSVAVVPWSDGRTVLAVAGGRVVTFWDPLTAGVAAEPLAFVRDVTDLAAVSLPGGRTVLAVADGPKWGLVQLIDPETGAWVAEPVQRLYGVTSIATVRREGRTLLACRERNEGHSQLHDPMTGEPEGVVAWADLGAVEVLGPDGEKLLARSDGTARGVIVLSEADSGARVGVLCGHMDAVAAMVALPLPDGRTLLASAAADATVRLWDPASGYATYSDSRFADFPFPARRLVTAPVENRTVLAVGTRTEKSVQLWDGDTGAAVGEPLRWGSDRIVPETAVPIADGRTLIATGHEDYDMRFWDPATSQVVYRKPPNYGSVSAITAVPLPDGRTVPATGCTEQVVVWDDLDTCTTRRFSTRPNTGIVGALAAVPIPTGGSILMASVGWKKRGYHVISRWDPVTGGRLGDLVGHGSLVHALAVVPDTNGRYLLAAGNDRGFVQIWDPVSGALLAGPFPGGSRCVFALAGTRLPDGSGVLACASKAHRIRLWDTAGEPVGKPLSGHGAPVRLLATLPDGLVASWGEDATLRLWDVASGTQVCASVPTGAVAVTALAAVEDWCVVTGDADGMVQMWDLATGAAVGAPMRGHDGSVTSVVSMPTAAGDTQVVSADRAGMLWQWDPATGVGHCRTSTFGASPTAIPLPDGGALMASIRPFTIQTWDPATGKPAGTIRTRLPNDAIMVALSGPNGRPLLARSSARAGSGPEAFVYDPMTGAEYSGVFSVPAGDLTDLISHLAAVPGPDGHDLLACGGRHGAIQLWDPVTGTAIGEPLTGHSSLSALAALRVSGATVLASAGRRQYGELEDALRLWDVATGACLSLLHLDMPILSLTAWDNRLAVHCDNGILVLEFDQLTG